MPFLLFAQCLYHNPIAVKWSVCVIAALAVSIYQLLSMFVVPALLMIMCYFCVIQELWASTKVVASLTRHSASVASKGANVASTSTSTSTFWKSHYHRDNYLSRWPHKKQQQNEQSGASSSHQHFKTCRSYIGVRHARKQV